ncbi:MAG: hypothetical protein ACRD1S_18430 [Vicinamibacterales bacterium]
MKVRFSNRQEFVVAGYKPTGDHFDSLLVGYFGQNQLFYSGRVRAGLTPMLRADVFKRLKPLGMGRCPFREPAEQQGQNESWGEGIPKRT